MLTRFHTALAFVKKNRKRARYFNAAANERIGSAMYGHLTGSGARSLRCLLPKFDPDGPVKILLIFLLFAARDLKMKMAIMVKGYPCEF